MSGHSHWSTIKRKKGASDAKRAKLFAKLARSVQVAAKGGADPAANLALKMAIEQAKTFNLPKDTIERAVGRGAGLDKNAQTLESAVYEAFGPQKTAFIVTLITDNKNRSLGELRRVFERHGGKLVPPGTTQWLFEHKGLVLATPIAAAANKEQLALAAIDGGAENFSWQDNNLELVCKAE